MRDHLSASQASSDIEQLSERYLSGLARVDPYAAMRDGIGSNDFMHTDYSTEGVASRIDHARDVLAAAKNIQTSSQAHRVTSRWLTEMTAGEIALWEHDPHTPLLRLLDGPIVDVVVLLRNLLAQDPIDWDLIEEKLARVPVALGSMQSNLADGMAAGKLATRRQAEIFAEYCEDSGGQRGRGVLDWLMTGIEAPANRERQVHEKMVAAQRSLTELAHYLRSEYLPHTSSTDVMGADRYELRLAYYTGDNLDAGDLYEQCWKRFRSTLLRLREVCHEVAGSAEVGELIWALEVDPNEQLRGDSDVCEWLATEMERTNRFVAGTSLPALDDEYIPEVRLAHGEARAVMQLERSRDRPTPTLWVKETGEIALPKWRYLALVHAVGIPGTWYQINRWDSGEKSLTRGQRMLFHRTAYAGWGHYATQMLDDLGYYDSPAKQVSFLQREMLQSVRVLVDVGYNLGLKVPDDSEICAGNQWSEAVGTQFIAQSLFMSRQSAAVEMRRSISSSGQFPSYRVVSDALAEGRANAEKQLGNKFDLFQYHSQGFDLGPLGLRDFREEMAQIPMLQNC